MAQLQESRSLRVRARHLYERAGDHAGAARISSNLALVALGKAEKRGAHPYLADAFPEESKIAAPDPGDLAAMCYAQCLLEERKRDLEPALTSVDRAIDLWTQHYGSHYYLLATGYSLRAQLLRETRKVPAALEDFQHSLAILKQNAEEKSRVYFLLEALYANLLRESGNRVEAQRLSSEARDGLAGLRNQQCQGCTISADSFR